MKKTDQVDITTELCFLEEFILNRAGMIKEIQTEFNIIRMCLTQLGELGKDYLPMIERVMVMPLRKLLCDKNSVLLKIAPDIKLCPIGDKKDVLSDGFTVIRPDLTARPQELWMPIREWRKQKIAWIEKTSSDLPNMYPAFIYENIVKKLDLLIDCKVIKGKDKKRFESYFEIKHLSCDDSEEDVYIRINPSNPADNTFIFNLLKTAGYYDLTVKDFIKHIANKRGAHIDVGHSGIIETVNYPLSELLTPIICISLQMIWAVTNQIPELQNYWPDMPMTPLK